MLYYLAYSFITPCISIMKWNWIKVESLVIDYNTSHVIRIIYLIQANRIQISIANRKFHSKTPYRCPFPNYYSCVSVNIIRIYEINATVLNTSLIFLNIVFAPCLFRSTGILHKAQMCKIYQQFMMNRHVRLLFISRYTHAELQLLSNVYSFWEFVPKSSIYRCQIFIEFSFWTILFFEMELNWTPFLSKWSFWWSN